MRLRYPKGIEGPHFLKSQTGGFVYWQSGSGGNVRHVITDRAGNVMEESAWESPSGRVGIMKAAKPPRRYSLGKMVKFTAWTYDVWGNKRDGFEVNDRSKVGTFSCDLGTWKNERTLKQLAKDILGVKRNVRLSSISVDGDDMAAYFEYEPDAYPLGEFVRE